MPARIPTPSDWTRKTSSSSPSGCGLPRPPGAVGLPPGAVPRRMSERPAALVTGAAHGQGYATSLALALAKAGYDIIALDVAAPLAYPGYAMGTSGELEALRAKCEES